MATVFRGEQYELSYGKEATFGVDPGTSALTRVLGVFERGQLGDPDIEFTPYYGSGGALQRSYFRAYRGKWTMEANISDILLLDASALMLPLGAVATTGPVSSMYTHTITETAQLPSFTMHTSFWRADDAVGTPGIMRRYHGCKASRATISAEEGDRLKLSLDSIPVKDLTHNVVGETFRYAALTKPTLDYPELEPYFFSGGYLEIEGTQFARVRSFRLDINNNCEPKYYIAGHDVSIPIPFSILEGRREYTLALSIDVDDTSLYKEILTQGLDNCQPIGISVKFKIERRSCTLDTGEGEVDIDEARGDYVLIELPSGTASFPSNQGCFIKKGKLDIDSGSSAVTQELDMLVRSCKITAKDTDPWTGL